MSNWEHFSVSIYLCDDARSRKYGHVGRVSKIREWKMFRSYTCSVQVGDIIVIVEMDTDTGSRGVFTLATREANRARQRQRFESETPEE